MPERTALEHELLSMLEIIVLNARLIPDPEMEGKCDIYSVPLDDISQASEILAREFGEP